MKDDVSVSSVSQEEVIRLEQRLAAMAEEKEAIHSQYQVVVSESIFRFHFGENNQYIQCFKMK